jgi:hypothetical protein
LADRRLEARRFETSVQSLEVRIGIDHSHRLGVGLAKPHATGLFIEGGFRNRLLQHLPVKPEGARLLHGQGAAELPAELLQLVGVDLAELLGRNLGSADLGQRRLSESLEDVGDAPDSKTDDQNTHHHGHDNLAEPV